MTPKTLGADIELGNAWIGSRRHGNWDAAAQMLRASRGLRVFRGVSPSGAATSTESGRHWLKNGGCLYIDLSHLEMCVPETASALDHAAAVHAMLRIVRSCRRRAERDLAPGQELFVNAHVSDGSLDTSWGAHQNVQVSRSFWDGLFDRKPHRLALVASFLAAAAPVFGQGLLLPVGGSQESGVRSQESGRCRYVLSARAHHIGELTGLQTTIPFRRNLVNRRDEAHAGDTQARLHLISLDPNLQPAAIILRTGLLQLVLAALESDVWFDGALLLEDPVAALRAWSASFSAETAVLRPIQVRRAGGGGISLLDWHRRLLTQLRHMLETISEEIVPDRKMILDLWEDTLSALVAGDLDRLATRLDWALKWRILAEELPACAAGLADPALRMLDQIYSHVDDRLGLFWTFWREGLVDRCGLESSRIEHFMHAGDPRTRSGLRGELVRRLAPWITDMDWAYIEVAEERHSWWAGVQRRRLDLSEPAAASADTVAALRRQFPSDRQLLARLLRSRAESDNADENLSPGRQGQHSQESLP